MRLPSSWLCLGCWLLADRLVVPILEVTGPPAKINADNLSRRLPVSGHQDELEQMVVTLNQMLERLEIAFRKVRQFSGDASHELRTPLTILRGETEVALRWAKDPDGISRRAALESGRDRSHGADHRKSAGADQRARRTNRCSQIEEFSLNDLIQALYLQAQMLG